jgi:hypothetical protein
MKARNLEDVLCQSEHPKPRANVRRAYKVWRVEHGIPDRCDIQAWWFHTNPPIWVDKELRMVLDHVNGNKCDDSPQNLRYVCPNCDSQLSTRGGKNIGRVVKNKKGEYILMEDGRRHHYLIPDTARLKITTHAPSVVIAKPT